MLRLPAKPLTRNSCRAGQAPGEQDDGSGVEERDGGMSAGLGVLGEVLVTVRPGEDTLDDPASGEDLEADLVGDLIDDFKGDRGDVCNAVGSVDPLGAATAR